MIYDKYFFKSLAIVVSILIAIAIIFVLGNNFPIVGTILGYFAFITICSLGILLLITIIADDWRRYDKN